MSRALLFESSLGRPDSAARAGASFAASLALQVTALAGLMLLPLLNTYEIDFEALSLRAIRLAPPPPPAPPPASVRPVAKPTPERYRAAFQAPSAIPDKVAILHDAGEPVAAAAGMPAPQGLAGGTGTGVLGIFPVTGQQLARPPPIRVGGRVQNARLIHQVQPVYPPEAIAERISGLVKLEAVVATDGSVRDLKLVEGHPQLAVAAMDAVAQWRYRPTQLNGMDVEVVTLVDVRFNLTIVEEDSKRKRRRRNVRP